MENENKNSNAVFGKNANICGEKTKNVLCYLFTALFIAGAFVVCLAVYNVYPFSQKYMSSYDLNAQIAPLLEHFFDVFEGKSSLFYTYSLAGGMDMFGSLVYCAVSPFTFIYFLFGKGRVCYATSVVLPLKLVCVSVSALYYLNKKFKNLPHIVKSALAVAYTYCGYLFVANTYINWVDLLIYMPFLAAGFEKLVKKGKKLAFAVPLALMFYTTFSITAFSLFIIFPIVVAYVMITSFDYAERNAERRAEILTDLCFSLLIAIALALPVLVPSFMAFASSERRGGLFDNLGNGISANPLYAKFSYILTDSFAVILTLLYFARHGISDSKSKFLCFSLFITMIPVFVDESMILLNFGSYMSYALRFGFLNGFYFFYVAATYLNEVLKPSAEKNRSVGGGSVAGENVEINGVLTGETGVLGERATFKNKTKAFFKRFFANKTAYVCCLSVICAGVFVGWFFLYRGVVTEKYVESFAGRFAHSLGGLEVTSLLTAGVLLVFAVGLPFIIKGRLNKTPFIGACVAVLAVQTVFYDYALVKGNSNDYANLAEIGGITEQIDAENGGTGRIKLGWDYVSADAPLTLHTNSFTVFSSLADKRNFAPMHFFGYGGNGKNVMRSYNGTMLGDCLLGYEYFITKSSGNGLPCYADNPAYKSINGTYSAYKNEWSMPHAFKVKSGDLGALEKNDAQNYNKLLNFLCEGESACEYAVDANKVSFEDGEVVRVRFRYEVAGDMFIVCNVPEKYEAKYRLGGWDSDDAKELTAGQIIRAGHGNNYGYSIYVKAYNGSDLQKLEKSEIATWFLSFIISDESVRKITENAKNNAAEISLSANAITANVVAAEGEYLFLNYISLKGHTAYVNGKQAEFIDNGLNFMLVKLEEGQNTVEIVYRSPYVLYAAFGLAAGLFVLFCVLMVYRKKRVLAFLTRPVYYAALGLGALILVFFFVMPLGVFAFKAIKAGVVSFASMFKKP